MSAENTDGQVSEAVVKITLRVSPEAKRDIEWISRRCGGISITEVFRRAIGTEKFLLEQKEKGCSILIEDQSSARIRELILR